MASPQKDQNIINLVAQGAYLEALGASESDTQLEIRRKHLKLSQEFGNYPEIQNALNQAWAKVIDRGDQRPSQIDEPWLEDLVIPKDTVQSPLSNTSAPSSLQDDTDITTSVIPIPQMRLTKFLMVERIVLIFCLMLLALLVFVSRSPIVLLSGTIVVIAGFLSFLAVLREVSHPKKKRRLSQELLDIQTGLRHAREDKKRLPVSDSSLKEKEQGQIASIYSRWCESNQKAKREVNTNHEALQRRLDEILIIKQGLNIQNETKRDLDKKRAAFLNNRLGQWTLDDAEIAGIGTNLKRQLMLAGIRSAADFVDIAITVSSYNSHQTKIPQIVLASGKRVRVSGIGLQKAQGLLAWRKNIESIINMELPQSLSSAEIQTIQQMSDKLSRLRIQEDEARQQFDMRKKQIVMQCRQQHMELSKEILTYQERRRIELKELQDDLRENRLLLCHLRQIFSARRDELASCEEGTFAEYIIRILTPWWRNTIHVVPSAKRPYTAAVTAASLSKGKDPTYANTNPTGDPRYATGMPVVVNKMSLVYHKPECEWKYKIATDNRINTTKGDAIKRGYHPCGVCRP